MIESILPSNFNFYICGVDELKKYEDRFITDIVAFSHPSTQENGPDYSKFNLSPNIERFIVHDVFDKSIHPDCLIWPNERLVKKMISRFESIKKRIENGDQVDCLFHCHAGISRSTAGAFIFLSLLTGEWKERDCHNEIFNRRPVMRPNPLMVKIADDILQRKGKMYDLVKLDTKEKIKEITRGEDRDILLFG